MSWQIDLLNVEGVRIDEIHVGEFVATVRELAKGEWSATTPRDALSVDPAQVQGVRVWDGIRIIFSGEVAPITKGAGGADLVTASTNRTVKFAGIDSWAPLVHRLAFPDPSKYEPWDVEADVRTGVASSVAAGFVLDNLGSNALADRQEAVRITDPIIGLESTWSARLGYLSDLVAQICADGGITCQVTNDAEARTIVKFAERQDLSLRSIISDLGRFEESLVRLISPSATWVLGAGSGEGTGRDFASVGLDTTRRREKLVEHSGATGSVLEARALAALTEAQAAFAVSATIGDELEWLTDYNVGDSLGVEIEAVRYSLPVVGVRFEHRANRSRATPVLGDIVTDRYLGLVSDVEELVNPTTREIK